MNSECKLQLIDMYFEKSEFSQIRGDSNSEYNSSFEISLAINNCDETKIKVTIDTSVSNENKSISVNLRTVGIFKIERNGLSDDEYEHLMKVNTVAIMFPYIRSQLSLITTQPGIQPIMMPPININILINSMDEQE